MKKLKKYNSLRLILAAAIIAFMISFAGSTVMAAPLSVTNNQSAIVAASGTSKLQVCGELQKLDANACQGTSSSILQSVIKPIMQILIIVVGGVSVLVIVVGGFLYVVSVGDPNTTKRAKDDILYAVVGLVISLFAQAIVSFVLGAVG